MNESDPPPQTKQAPHAPTQGNTEILEMIATGQSASNIYDAIALMYEARNPGLRCSLLELKDNRLMHGGAPSLPKEYCEAVNGLKNGPEVGSCGTSTYTGKRVLVADIETDPKWADIKHVALPHGMRCCWSEPIKNSKGKVLGAFGMYFDYPALPDEHQLSELKSAARLTSIIMDRDHREKELRRAQKMEAIGQLTGGIAHDFNNILSIILGNLELLEGQLNVDKKIQKRLDSIKHSAVRAADLTKKLLSFSRRESEITSSTNINHVIVGMQNLLARSLTPQIEITQNLTEGLWCTEIDPGDFEDVLLNIAINARDAMAGSGNLAIETKNCTLDASYCKLNTDAVAGEYVQLSISDNGSGISPNILDRIFEPYFTTKEMGKGTGLGLAMVFGFVERSGGNIRVYSEVGIGTTLNIYLPHSKHKEQVTKNAQQADHFYHGTESILVVDDEVALLELVEEALLASGYRVLTATNAKEALQLIAKNPTLKLMFSDVVMPGGINGFELAEQAAMLYPNLKILMTSGYTDLALTRNGQSKFKTELLSKPYTIRDLTYRVRQILDS